MATILTCAIRDHKKVIKVILCALCPTHLFTLDYAQHYYCPEPIVGPTARATPPYIQLTSQEQPQPQQQQQTYYNNKNENKNKYQEYTSYTTPYHYDYQPSSVHNSEIGTYSSQRFAPYSSSSSSGGLAGLSYSRVNRNRNNSYRYYQPTSPIPNRYRPNPSSAAAASSYFSYRRISTGGIYPSYSRPLLAASASSSYDQLDRDYLPIYTDFDRYTRSVSPAGSAPPIYTNSYNYYNYRNRYRDNFYDYSCPTKSDYWASDSPYASRRNSITRYRDLDYSTAYSDEDIDFSEEHLRQTGTERNAADTRRIEAASGSYQTTKPLSYTKYTQNVDKTPPHQQRPAVYSQTANLPQRRATEIERNEQQRFHNIRTEEILPSGCFAQKKMMVSKWWNGCFPQFTPDRVHRHNFYLCQWQRNTQVRIIYLFYRWLAAITCLAALVCSLLDIGRTEEHFENHYAKWWIYLTHWGLLFCTIQAWLAAWIVTQGMMVEREDFEIVRQAKKSRLHYIYWIFYTLATVYSFIITTCYWGLVHNPEIHKIDALNVMVHICNSIIMLIDLAIVGHPIKLSHIYFTTGVGLAYAIFTGIYFLAGGTDRKNQVYIYPMMDWTKPGKAIIVTACAIIFVIIVHFCCFLLYRARVWLFTKLCIRGARHFDGDMGEGLHEESSARCIGSSSGGPLNCTGGSSYDYSHQQQYPILHSQQPRRTHQHQHHHHHQHQHQQSTTTQQSQQQQQQAQQQPLDTQTIDANQNQAHQSTHQYQHYAGYKGQPVVAGVSVGIVSTDGAMYHTQDNNNMLKSRHHSHGANSAASTKSNHMSRSSMASHLESTQHGSEYVNPNKIMEYKM